MERWIGTVLNINTTCTEFGPKYLLLHVMHVHSGCDTTYLYGKIKTRTFNTLLSEIYPGLSNIIGEMSIYSDQLMEAVTPFFTALYNQVPEHPWS